MSFKDQSWRKRACADGGYASHGARFPELHKLTQAAFDDHCRDPERYSTSRVYPSSLSVSLTTTLRKLAMDVASVVVPLDTTIDPCIEGLAEAIRRVADDMFESFLDLSYNEELTSRMDTYSELAFRNGLSLSSTLAFVEAVHNSSPLVVFLEPYFHGSHSIGGNYLAFMQDGEIVQILWCIDPPIPVSVRPVKRTKPTKPE